MRITKVTIVRNPAPPEDGINALLLVLGHNLGLFSMRDKDKSCYRIFIILVRALKTRSELTSDEIASQTGLSRGTVIHHVNRLMDAGIVTNYKNKYFLNVDDLASLVEQLRDGVNSMFDDFSKVAKRIDEKLNISPKSI